MKQVEIEGESIDEAIEKALGLLGVERDKVSVDILTEATKGLLGFGRQNARVRVALRESVVAEMPVPANEPTEEPASATDEPSDDRASATTDEPLVTDERYNEVATTSKEILAKILTLMGVSAEIETKPGKDANEVELNIKGESGGLLIGRRGQTLEALQYILSRIVAERIGPEGPQPIVDTENYRMRRVRTLEDMALRMGEKAKRSRKTMGIDALSARDRRIIHLTLQDDPWLTTKSLGQGPYRRLLIIPEGDRKEQDAQDTEA
jgi:spoIIIJ-associated protein